MNTRQSTQIAIAVLSSALTFGAFAQGPVGDEFRVTFDRAVQVGSQSLPAGEYTVKQVTSASNPRVLEFKTTDDNKLMATVTAIPVAQNTPPSETKVILQDEGGGARLSRIWVQGRTYGYGFPGEAMAAPKAVASSAQLSGSYAAPAPAPITTAERRAEPPAQTPAPAATAPPAQTPAPTPTPTPDTTAQTPAQPPAETPTAAPAPAATPEIPATGLGWVEVMAAGFAMAAAGLLLHKRETRRS
jgi:hypothetical protein